MLQGIDVAKWQGDINWAKVKKNFAILKVTDKSNAIEPAFEKNYAGCRSNKIPVGGYKYVYAKTVNEAEIEALCILSVLKDRVLECGIWLDMEDSSIKSLGKSRLSQIIVAEAKILQAHGQKVGIYCNKDWYDNVLPGKLLSESYPFWIARYPSKDTGTFNEKSTLSPKSYAKAWQYSQKGKVEGIKGAVDLDVAFESFDLMFKSSTMPSGTYYPRYTGNGTSIVSALATVGEKNTSMSHRKLIAKKNGILYYEGSIKQNLKLVELLKQGKLLKA